MPGTLPVSGNIDAKSFPFLVMDLHRHGATGSLKVDGPAYQKALYFRGGRILFGSSNDPRDQLGAILIDAGKLTPEQLEEVNAKVGPGSPLAKVLADSGLVTQQELSDAARAKVERILGDILGYAEGSFEFEDGVLPKGAVDLKLQTERLVLGAVKQFADRAFVLGHLGSLAVVLTPTAEMGARAGDIRTETGGLVDQFDGRRTLKEAIGQTQVEEFDAAKIACALLFLGLLTPAQQETEVPEVSAAPPAEEAPFFVDDSAPPPEDADSAFDLGATARMAFADDAASPEPALAGEEDTLPGGSPAAAPLDTGLAFADEPEAPSTVAPPSHAEEPPPVVVPPLVPTPEPAGEELPFSFTQSEAPPPNLEPPAAPPASHDFAPAMPPVAPPEPAPPPLSVPPSPYPSIEPPSETDLKELDTLLRPSRPGPSPASLPAVPPRGSFRDAPRFVPQGSGARARAGGGASKALIFLGVLVVLAAVGGGAIWYLGLFGLRGARPTTPTPVTSPTALPPPTLATQPTAEPTVAAVLPAATPAPPTDAPPQRPPVQAAPPPVAPPPTPQAAPPPAGGGPGTLLRAGRLAESASASVAQLRGSSSRHTVQILVACSEETVHKALANVSSAELFIVPVKHRGRDCYRMCWGVYDTPAAAAEADRRLPPYFRQGGAVPRVVPVTAILP